MKETFQVTSPAFGRMEIITEKYYAVKDNINLPLGVIDTGYSLTIQASSVTDYLARHEGTF